MASGIFQHRPHVELDRSMIGGSFRNKQKLNFDVINSTFHYYHHSHRDPIFIAAVIVLDVALVDRKRLELRRCAL
jgi:hypothetical protein